MKTVYLIRHAKSDWNQPGNSDFDRPLNPRGTSDAPFMGNQLSKLNVKFDAILCSEAKRTTQTACAICSSIGFDTEKIDFKSELYLPTLPTLMETLNELDNQHQVVALVCHNPAITALSNYLTADYIDNIVTCGIVKIELEIENWNQIIQGIGRKVFYIYPKMYR